MFSRARTFLDRCPPAHACIAALVSWTLASAAHAQAAAIFQIDDIPGEIHLSDRTDATTGVDVRRIILLAVEVASPAPQVGAMRPFAAIVRAAARAERLPPALIDAVIAVESAGRVRAVSARGASGLMQLMPATARSYGVTDIFDPAQNIAAGARHLRRLLDRYDQDVTRALAAYNAGAGVVDRAGARRDAWPAETATYVPDVLGRLVAPETPTPIRTP